MEVAQWYATLLGWQHISVKPMHDPDPNSFSESQICAYREKQSVRLHSGADDITALSMLWSVRLCIYQNLRVFAPLMVSADMLSKC